MNTNRTLRHPWLLAALAAACLAAAQAHGAESAKPARRTGASARPTDPAWRPVGTARRGRFRSAVTVTGALKPLNEVQIRSPFGGAITTMWPNGTKAKKGDLILEIDTEHIQDRVDRARDELAIKEAEQTKARQFAKRRRARARLNVVRAAERVKIATLRLDLVKEGATEDELAEGEKRVKNAELIHASLQEEFKIMRELVKGGVETQDKIESLGLELETARIDLEKSRLEREKLRARPEKIELEEQRLELSLAKNDFENSQNQEASIKKATKAQVERFNAGIRRVKQKLRRDEQTMKRAKIRAPQDGIILWGSGHWGRGWYPGAYAHHFSVVMSLPDYDRMKVMTQIAEDRIGNIEVGTRAIVRIGAYPERRFDGKIIRIAQLARDAFENRGSWVKTAIGNADRQVFDIEIGIEGEIPRLLPGFRCQCEIILAELDDVVFVPKNAVFYQAAREKNKTDKNGKTGKTARPYVLPVAEPGRRRFVTLGPANDRFQVIAKGAKSGETFLLTPPVKVMSTEY